mmetsp:Transcript_3150/g.10535  ORF Transcript_3150/g.10535 Transcript_3150/m.10535 type:complete len:228 (-) Transcript_3150:1531-2214(-)
MPHGDVPKKHPADDVFGHLERGFVWVVSDVFDDAALRRGDGLFVADPGGAADALRGLDRERLRRIFRRRGRDDDALGVGPRGEADRRCRQGARARGVHGGRDRRIGRGGGGRRRRAGGRDDEDALLVLRRDRGRRREEPRGRGGEDLAARRRRDRGGGARLDRDRDLGLGLDVARRGRVPTTSSDDAAPADRAGLRRRARASDGRGRRRRRGDRRRRRHRRRPRRRG